MGSFIILSLRLTVWKLMLTLRSLWSYESSMRIAAMELAYTVELAYSLHCQDLLAELHKPRSPSSDSWLDACPLKSSIVCANAWVNTSLDVRHLTMTYTLTLGDDWFPAQ